MVCGDWDPETRGSPSTAGSKGQMKDKHGSQDTWSLKGGEKIRKILHLKFPSEDRKVKSSAGHLDINNPRQTCLKAPVSF